MAFAPISEETGVLHPGSGMPSTGSIPIGGGRRVPLQQHGNMDRHDLGASNLCDASFASLEASKWRYREAESAGSGASCASPAVMLFPASSAESEDRISPAVFASRLDDRDRDLGFTSHATASDMDATATGAAACATVTAVAAMAAAPTSGRHPPAPLLRSQSVGFLDDAYRGYDLADEDDRIRTPRALSGASTQDLGSSQPTAMVASATSASLAGIDGATPMIEAKAFAALPVRPALSNIAVNTVNAGGVPPGNRTKRPGRQASHGGVDMGDRRLAITKARTASEEEMTDIALRRAASTEGGGDDEEGEGDGPFLDWESSLQSVVKTVEVTEFNAAEDDEIKSIIASPDGEMASSPFCADDLDRSAPGSHRFDPGSASSRSRSRSRSRQERLLIARLRRQRAGRFATSKSVSVALPPSFHVAVGAFENNGYRAGQPERRRARTAVPWEAVNNGSGGGGDGGHLEMPPPARPPMLGACESTLSSSMPNLHARRGRPAPPSIDVESTRECATQFSSRSARAVSVGGNGRFGPVPESPSDILNPALSGLELGDEEAVSGADAVAGPPSIAELVYDEDDDSKYPIPVMKASENCCKCVSIETVAAMVRGEFDDVIDGYEIIDCRYPFEFEGGHIDGALVRNIYTEKRMKLRFMRASALGLHRRVIIFHCEFSSKRGPSMARALRTADRNYHYDNPQRGNIWDLFYPNVFVMHGGYREFFARYPELCTPQSYVEMSDPRFVDSLRRCEQMSNKKRMSKVRSRSVALKRSNSRKNLSML